ncbi:MAG: LptF/LptG family permease [Opitutaceae bacterium]|nr:LptF/LptG family permease [Opitutaceae bacterium]MBP9913594.1 LptF/LptG family permease [Opitutaceae bacterium]
MNTYDRHLLGEWLKILGLVMGACVGLLFVQVLYDDFRTLNDLGARGADFWVYFFVTLPSFLALVLLFSLLVSLLFVLGKLHRANEFIALRAAGVSLLRITAPVWLIGLLACGLSWYLNASIVPWSVEESRRLRDNLQFLQQAKSLTEDRVGAVYSVGFDNRPARRMWFFNRYSQFARKGYGVSVSELDAQRRETRRIVAAEAWYDETRKGWVFKQGRELAFEPTTGEMIRPRPFAELFMERYREDPRLMLIIDRKAGDLSIFELRRLIDYYEAEHNAKAVPYQVRYFGLLADTLGPLIVIALAVPFAVSGVRVNPAVGVSKSIGLFFLYYVLNNLATSLATKGLVDPLLAAWLPNIGMTGIAVWLFARLR